MTNCVKLNLNSLVGITFFFYNRTKLFLEYKLCKLLTRPLDERHSISRLSSRGLRGYSRQTVSYTTTTSTSLAQSRAASAYDDESDLSWQNDAERAGLFKYLRPGSRCISLPPMFGLGKKHCHDHPFISVQFLF